MTPALPDGSTVQVAPRKIYLPGDVVAFASIDRPLRVHRVLGYYLARSGWKLITKGDHASWIDPPVSIDRVLGLVRGGDCAPSIYNVSLRERLASLWLFLRKSVTSLGKQLVYPS